MRNYQRAHEPKTQTQETGHRALALAVVKRAVHDAHDKDPIKRVDALVWLRHEAPIWLDDIGLNYDLQAWRRWVSRGCPKEDRRTRVGGRANSRPPQRWQLMASFGSPGSHRQAD
jgi:hypothetical protein